MANRNLFSSLFGKSLANPDSLNAAGAPAYALGPKHQLAQYAVTGCLNGTFYASAEVQLLTVLQLSEQVDGEFLAKLALYARERAAMKDMPALLLAVLTQKAPVLLPLVFGRVLDNGKMLRNYVQILRSGTVGRKSLGSRPKRLVQQWLNQASDAQLIGAMVGQQPSLADVVKMAHPRPETAAREALFAYLIGKPHDASLLPVRLQAFEAFKRDSCQSLPDVPFQLLTALPLDAAAWKQIARQSPWRATLMNLNTFARHGVFDDAEVVTIVAARLRDPELVRKAKAYPYQLLAAWRAAAGQMPTAIIEALQEALDMALSNVPALRGNIVVCPDVSGSMHSPATGVRQGATSKVRCVDVAALVAAALLKRNPQARVLPFETAVVDVRLNSRDSVLTNAEKLAAIGGGGTNCSAPLELLNKESAKVDVLVFVSDNESWIDARKAGGTALMRQWQLLQARNPDAKLVCIDIQPNGTTQAPERPDVLNVGGFSDAVFDQLAWFAGSAGTTWLQEIETMSLSTQ